MNTSGSRNVLQLNRSIEKASTVMDAFTETAAAQGIDVADDLRRLERALAEFFTDRERRDAASAELGR